MLKFCNNSTFYDKAFFCLNNGRTKPLFYRYSVTSSPHLDILISLVSLMISVKTLPRICLSPFLAQFHAVSWNFTRLFTVNVLLSVEVVAEIFRKTYICITKVTLHHHQRPEKSKYQTNLPRVDTADYYLKILYRLTFNYGTLTLTLIFLIFLMSAISRRQVTMSRVLASLIRAMLRGNRLQMQRCSIRINRSCTSQKIRCRYFFYLSRYV